MTHSAGGRRSSFWLPPGATARLKRTILRGLGRARICSATSRSCAYQQFCGAGDVARAARCAFWLVLGHQNEGDMAHASGWLSRAQRLLDEGNVDCAERGYLMMPGAMEGIAADSEASLAMFERVIEIGERFNDRDLVAFGRQGQGRALIRLGEPAKGMAAKRGLI